MSGRTGSGAASEPSAVDPLARVSTSASPVGSAGAERATDVRAGKGTAAIAGLLAVGVALGIAELISGALAAAPSLVIAVGDTVIDNVPGWLERAAISVLGRNDKPVLLAGILVACLVLGAGLGVLGRTRYGLAAAGFGAFAGLGTVAGAADPQGTATAAVVVGLVAWAAGAAALCLLLRAATPHQERYARGQAGNGAAAATGMPARNATAAAGDGTAPLTPVARRTFLRGAGTAAAVAMLGAIGGRMLAASERVNVLRSAVRIPRPARPASAAPAGAALDVPGLTPLYMSNADFYRIDTALRVPQVDSTSWSLAVRGRVDRPYTLTYAELMDMEQVEADITLSCVSNEVGGDLVGNARWQGVPLRTLLERAGVQADATQVVGRSVDGFTAGFPTAIALDGRDAMVAVAMNGEPLPVAHGFPARLVVPGLYGYVSATKWLAAIELTTWEEFEGYWIPRGWAKDGPVKTQSRVDVPAANSTIAPGPQAVAGVAWAPHRGIEGVEVRVDDGPWQAAELADALGVDSWRQWVHTWDATPGQHAIAVRATDGTGETQTDQRTAVAPDGASGHHTIQVRVEA